MEAVELFAGAGGLAIGTAEAGFKHSAIVEWDKTAGSTLVDNRRRRLAATRDWSAITVGDVRKFDYANLGDVALVAGGPPCQPFSEGGKHRSYLDPRDMWPETVRAVQELRPKAFIFENVRGLARRAFATYFEYIVLSLSYPSLKQRKSESWGGHLGRLEQHHTSAKNNNLEYRVVYQLINAADFGVPQHRSRVFIVGFRSDLGIEWSFPEPTHNGDALLWSKWKTKSYWERHRVATNSRGIPTGRDRKRLERLNKRSEKPRGKPWRTVRDAIHTLPIPMEKKETKGVWNHSLNPGARQYKGHTGSLLDLPAKALKAGVHGVPGGENMLLLPSGAVRYFTAREAARIQTFPDTWRFQGAWSEAMRQIGNAVPIKLASKVAKSVAKQLEAK